MKLVEQLAFTAAALNQNSAEHSCFSTPIVSSPLQFCHHELWQAPHFTEHQTGLQTSRMLGYCFLRLPQTLAISFLAFGKLAQQEFQLQDAPFGNLALLQFIQSAI